MRYRPWIIAVNACSLKPDNGKHFIGKLQYESIFILRAQTFARASASLARATRTVGLKCGVCTRSDPFSVGPLFCENGNSILYPEYPSRYAAAFRTTEKQPPILLY